MHINCKKNDKIIFKIMAININCINVNHKMKTIIYYQNKKPLTQLQKNNIVPKISFLHATF